MHIDIPPEFLKVPYNGANFPGAVGFDGFGAGANCQVFAYSFLAHHGIKLPPFRSSELWEDREYTFVVTEFEPLDLLLFHQHQQAFGAHVTVYIGDERVFHLAAHNGYPRIETIINLQNCHKYRGFIGAKRPLRPS
jgi:cell wall-associated NlpC family hydrolase